MQCHISSNANVSARRKYRNAIGTIGVVVGGNRRWNIWKRRGDGGRHSPKDPDVVPDSFGDNNEWPAVRDTWSPNLCHFLESLRCQFQNVLIEIVIDQVVLAYEPFALQRNRSQRYWFPFQILNFIRGQLGEIDRKGRAVCFALNNGNDHARESDQGN